MILFDVWKNLLRDAGVSQVRFGAGQEILESELNELQTLFDLKLAKVLGILGSAYVGGSFSVSGGNLVIENGFFSVGGRIAQVDRATTPLRPNSRYVLRIYQRKADHESVLRLYGNRDGESVNNHILDPRYNQLLSVRMTWDWRLETITMGEAINDSGDIDILNMLDGDSPTTATPTLVIAHTYGLSDPPVIDDVIISDRVMENNVVNQVIKNDLAAHKVDPEAHEDRFRVHELKFTSIHEIIATFPEQFASLQSQIDWIIYMLESGRFGGGCNCGNSCGDGCCEEGGEDGERYPIVDNEFDFVFDDINDWIIRRGVWNEDMRRVEC